VGHHVVLGQLDVLGELAEHPVVAVVQRLGVFARFYPQRGLYGVGHADLWGRRPKLVFDPVQDRQQVPSKLSNVPGDGGPLIVVVHGRGSFRERVACGQGAIGGPKGQVLFADRLPFR